MSMPTMSRKLTMLVHEEKGDIIEKTEQIKGVTKANIVLDDTYAALFLSLLCSCGLLAVLKQIPIRVM